MKRILWGEKKEHNFCIRQTWCFYTCLCLPLTSFVNLAFYFTPLSLCVLSSKVKTVINSVRKALAMAGPS